MCKTPRINSEERSDDVSVACRKVVGSTQCRQGGRNRRAKKRQGQSEREDGGKEMNSKRD